MCEISNWFKSWNFPDKPYSIASVPNNCLALYLRSKVKNFCRNLCNKSYIGTSYIKKY